MNSLSCTVVKRNTPYANKSSQGEKPKWRHFIIEGEVPMEELKELYEYLGQALFEKSFKSKYTGETVRLVNGVFEGAVVTRLTFSCTEMEANRICSFFVSKGVEAKTVLATFPSKNK